MSQTKDILWWDVIKQQERGGRLTLTEYFRDKFSQVTLTKWSQWLHLNNSHAYPFCKTTPGTTSYLDVAIATIFVSVTCKNFVAKLFCQCNSGCTNKKTSSLGPVIATQLVEQTLAMSEIFGSNPDFEHLYDDIQVSKAGIKTSR